MYAVLVLILVLVVALAAITVAWWLAHRQLARERVAWQERVSQMAHDVRSPMLVIGGTADVLRLQVEDPALREALERIVAETRRLGRIVENHVAGAVVAQGTPLRREWVPVEELAAGALARLHPTADGERVRVEIADDVLAHIDPRLAELVIGNLLDHAARTAPRNAAIVLAARRSDDGVVIEVCDAHVGPERERESKDLSLCRAIAVAYGGSLELACESGRGTTVRLRLPDGGQPMTAQPAVEVS